MKTITLIGSFLVLSLLLAGCTGTATGLTGTNTNNQPETYVQEKVKNNKETQLAPVSNDTSLKTIESELDKTDVKTEDFSDL